MATKSRGVWPVLKRYDQSHLLRLAMPLGGIGTGTVSLGGRGNLQDFELVNRPAKGFTPSHTFFAVCVKDARAPRKPAIARLLEGPIDPSQFDGDFGCAVPNHGIPRFRRAEFLAAYPFGQVLLSDPAVPLTARIEAFNPLIPGDTAASSIPIAVLRFVLTNRTARPLAASVCGSLQNFIGADGSNHAPGWSNKPIYTAVMLGNRNERRQEAGVTGLLMTTTGTRPDAEQFGSLALATIASEGVTHRTAWRPFSWGDALLDFWDDLTADGRLDGYESMEQNAPIGSLAVAVKLPPRSSRAITFLLTWHFPNRKTWTPAPKPEAPVQLGLPGTPDPDLIGNHYCTQYRDAWEVATRTAPRLEELEAGTVKFVRALGDSDLPPAVKEAALFNVSTLRTQTCFRTPDGKLFGWEGCADHVGCCPGSCTHVWNYEHVTGFLFGELALGMRDTEFAHATSEQGLMSFRAFLPLSRAQEWDLAAADGQMGAIMRLYRDWRLSGDDEALCRLWPKARKALEFCWIPGGWDADRDGVMEGCQHNTMDVEYYGPNPQMGSWYLGALRAGEEMARRMGESDLAATCRDLFERGRAWMDANLFNGDYYEHQIRPAPNLEAIAPGLRHKDMGARDLENPELQLGAGCLIDQLVGQYTAHVCGLGYLLDPAHIRRTLGSLMKFNFKKNLLGHFNHLRSFALENEPAMLMATYPKGRRPKRPFPYYNEVMTGFEYTAAVHMLYEGMIAEGLRCIEAVRSRYDGLRRNPFDEAECGRHYARAMASWAAILALTGFEYSALDGSMSFAASRKAVQWFWSNGRAWGLCRQRPTRQGVEVTLTVLHGRLSLKRFTLRGRGDQCWETPLALGCGQSQKFTVSSRSGAAAPRRGNARR